jgi:hypothetical protein
MSASYDPWHRLRAASLAALDHHDDDLDEIFTQLGRTGTDKEGSPPFDARLRRRLLSLRRKFLLGLRHLWT